MKPKNSNFVDYVKILCRSGKGGAGSAHFLRDRTTAKGGPDGGDGGGAGLNTGGGAGFCTMKMILLSLELKPLFIIYGTSIVPVKFWLGVNLNIFLF